MYIYYYYYYLLHNIGDYYDRGNNKINRFASRFLGDKRATEVFRWIFWLYPVLMCDLSSAAFAQRIIRDGFLSRLRNAFDCQKIIIIIPPPRTPRVLFRAFANRTRHHTVTRTHVTIIVIIIIIRHRFRRRRRDFIRIRLQYQYYLFLLLLVLYIVVFVLRRLCFYLRTKQTP